MLYLTPGTTKIVLPDHFNRKINVGDIPKNVTELVFGADYNQVIEKNVIPPLVTHLILGWGFNQEIEQGVIPPSVTHLDLGGSFNKKLKSGVIPPSVTHLTFSRNYNHKLERNIIPSSVTHLTFGQDFNCILEPGDIPSSVTHLTFGYCYNQILGSDVFPPTLTHLTLGAKYSHRLARDIIPPSLTKLYLHHLSPSINISDYNEVNLYGYGAQVFGVTCPNTHSSSELISTYLPSGDKVTIITVTRKTPVNIYSERLNKLKAENLMIRLCNDLKEECLKMDRYGPIKVKFEGELNDAVKKAINDIFDNQIELTINKVSEYIEITY